MHDHIDIYCERSAPGLLDEPLNLVSNAAFLVASVMAFMLARREKATSPGIVFLIVMIALIGIGSSLFHSFANTWSKFADVIPIVIFQIGFIAVYASRVMSLNKRRTVVLVAGFFALSFASGFIPYDWLNGSLSYSPALIFLLGLGIYHMRTGKNEPYALLMAGGVFILSLMFRSIDMAVCDHLPIGVHYFWHMLNGVVLYLSVRAIIKNYCTPTAPP